MLARVHSELKREIIFQATVNIPQLPRRLSGEGLGPRSMKSQVQIPTQPMGFAKRSFISSGDKGQCL